MRRARRAGSTPSTPKIILPAEMSPCEGGGRGASCKGTTAGQRGGGGERRGSGCLRLPAHLQGGAAARDGQVPAPLRPQVAEVARGHQPDVVEGGAPQDAHHVLPHHVLARQDLQQRGLARAIGAAQQAPAAAGQGEAEVVYEVVAEVECKVQVANHHRILFFAVSHARHRHQWRICMHHADGGASRCRRDEILRSYSSSAGGGGACVYSTCVIVNHNA